MNRDDFMAFFRNDEQLNTLNADDRIEIFSEILLGSSDITKQRLENLIADYNVGDLTVIEIL
ncbi:hypothetical protein AAU57_08585 [Nonlabens sp. YIK11]|nr:hypothetical protein AAU57_08585 [Nonlabens sp. YIK11]